MSPQAIIRLQQNLFKQLQHQLPEELLYHNLSHTKDEVMPAVQLLCEELNISPDEQHLVFIAALCHDIGYIKQYSNNEEIGVSIATAVLPKYGCSTEEILVISQLIMATKMPQHPQSQLAEILCDADLATLGQPNFYQKSLLLHQELSFFIGEINLNKWHIDQYNFLTSHQYFTSAARHLWDNGKRKNIAKLLTRIP